MQQTDICIVETSLYIVCFNFPIRYKMMKIWLPLTSYMARTNPSFLGFHKQNGYIPTVHYGESCLSNFLNIKLMTSQSKPRYWSQRTILDFLVCLGTFWHRSHCFEAWKYSWSMRCFDKLILNLSSPSLPFSLKTSSTAFCASTWLTPFLNSAWHRNCTPSNKIITSLDGNKN